MNLQVEIKFRTEIMKSVRPKHGTQLYKNYTAISESLKTQC